jgi:hypothetical protein
VVLHDEIKWFDTTKTSGFTQRRQVVGYDERQVVGHDEHKFRNSYVRMLGTCSSWTLPNRNVL